MSRLRVLQSQRVVPDVSNSLSRNILCISLTSNSIVSCKKTHSCMFIALETILLPILQYMHT